MVAATFSIDRCAGSFWICARRYRLMPRVPAMTQAPAKRRFQALMPPRLVKVPLCRSGMARLASLACADEAARSRTRRGPAIFFKLFITEQLHLSMTVELLILGAPGSGGGSAPPTHRRVGRLGLVRPRCRRGRTGRVGLLRQRWNKE